MWRCVGIGLKVAWGVGGVEVYRPLIATNGGVPSAYSPGQLLEVSLSPPPFYPWERIPVNVARAFSWSHSGLWDCRRSETATRAGKGCHRNTCSRGCAGVSFCPTSVAVRLMAAQYWCLQSDNGGTVTVLLLQFLYALNLNALLVIVDVRLWSSVQFLAEARAVLWTCR